MTELSVTKTNPTEQPKTPNPKQIVAAIIYGGPPMNLSEVAQEAQRFGVNEQTARYAFYSLPRGLARFNRNYTINMPKRPSPTKFARIFNELGL